MDTQKIANLVTKLEAFNRLYGEARENDKYNLTSFFQWKILELRSELIDLGIPLDINIIKD